MRLGCVFLHINLGLGHLLFDPVIVLMAQFLFLQKGTNRITSIQLKFNHLTYTCFFSIQSCIQFGQDVIPVLLQLFPKQSHICSVLLEEMSSCTILCMASCQLLIYIDFCQSDCSYINLNETSLKRVQPFHISLSGMCWHDISTSDSCGGLHEKCYMSWHDFI